MDRRGRGGMMSVLARAPLPSLDKYLGMSLLFAVGSLYYVLKIFREQPTLHTLIKEEISNVSLVYSTQMGDFLSDFAFIRMIYFALSNHVLTWALVNSFYAGLALTGKILIAYAFKELTRQESNQLRDTFFSLLFFNLVFITSVIGAWVTERALPWLLWFGIVDFCHVINFAAQLRFKFVNTGTGVSGRRSLVLSVFLFSLTTSILFLVLSSRRAFSISVFLFVLADAVQVFARSLHWLFRGLLQWERPMPSCFYKATKSLPVLSRLPLGPDSTRHTLYLLELYSSVFIDAVQFLHYTQMMVLAPLGLNLTCIFFFYHLRMSYTSLTTSLARHKKHNNIFRHIESAYPAASDASTERCIVCWESLSKCRVLPCHHRFHDWCLMWWLEADPSCPTCRRPVSTPQPQQVRYPETTFSHLFRFDSRHLGFLRLPSFSIEFSHNVGGGLLPRRPPENSQLTNLAEQVRDMFPQLSLEVIMEDLRVSGSSQATIENILEGRLGFPGDEDENTDDDDWDADEREGGDASESSEEPLPQAVDVLEQSPSSSASHNDFQQRKRDFILLYRRRYIESPKGKDLREKNIS